MSDPKDPVQQLTDTLTLLRVEIADVKSRQITEERLKHLQAALEDTALKIEKVAESAGEGAQRGAERLTHEIGQVSRNIKDTTYGATQSLSDAIRIIQGNFLSQKRNIRLLTLFSALLGLLLGAFGGVLIGDYQLATEFGESIQGSEAEWYCNQAGGTLYIREEKGNFCAVWTGN